MPATTLAWSLFLLLVVKGLISPLFALGIGPLGYDHARFTIFRDRDRAREYDLAVFRRANFVGTIIDHRYRDCVGRIIPFYLVPVAVELAGPAPFRRFPVSHPFRGQLDHVTLGRG